MKTDSLSSDELRELFVNVDGLSFASQKRKHTCWSFIF